MGWKQIANYLQCGVRTAQRWERFGLPVQRTVPGDRSPIHAQSVDIDAWLHSGRLRRAANDGLFANVKRARKLREEIPQTRANLRLKLDALRKEMAILRARRRRN